MFIYLNKNELPRVYINDHGEIVPLKIIKALPVFVVVDLPGRPGQLPLNEPYFPYWEIKTQDATIPTFSDNQLVSANISNISQLATIKFNPPFSKLTMPLSLLTSLTALVLIFT